MSRHRALSGRQVFGVPVLVGLLSAVGLAAALLGDGIFDAVSWICLALPIAIVAAAATRARRQRDR